jgi:hypothetical protein
MSMFWLVSEPSVRFIANPEIAWTCSPLLAAGKSSIKSTLERRRRAPDHDQIIVLPLEAGRGEVRGAGPQQAPVDFVAMSCIVGSWKEPLAAMTNGLHQPILARQQSIPSSRTCFQNRARLRKEVGLAIVPRANPEMVPAPGRDRPPRGLPPMTPRERNRLRSESVGRDAPRNGHGWRKISADRRGIEGGQRHGRRWQGNVPSRSRNAQSPAPSPMWRSSSAISNDARRLIR